MLEEKILLSVGIIIILFGAIGVVGTGFIYYNTKPYIDKLPTDIQQIFSIANHTTYDTLIAINNAAGSLRTAADNIDVSILGWKPFVATADSLRATASSIEEVGGDIEVFTRQIESIKNSILSQISLLKLIIDASFGWIGVLHTIFILIGISFLCIRKRLSTAS